MITKVIYSCFLVLVLFSALSGQCVVTAPNGHEKLFLGSQYVIRWNPGSFSGTVKLVLRLNNAYFGDITAGIPNNGSFTWKVGDCLNIKAPLGGGYKVRVKSQDNQCLDDSNGSFAIVAIAPGDLQLSKKPDISGLTMQIQVQEPVAGSKHAVGLPLRIKWDKSSIAAYSSVAIYLMYKPGGEILETIKSNAANTGLYESWNAPQKYSWPGTQYVVKVAADTNRYGFSGVFTIFNPPPVVKKEKFIVRQAVITNSWGFSRQDNGKSDCLSAPVVQAGRPAGSGEVKIGHYVSSGKHGACFWVQGYYFRSRVYFDTDGVKGRDIVSATLKLSMSDSVEQGPQGSLATNEELFNKCDIYILNGPWPSSQPAANFYPGAYYKSFTIYSPGNNAEVDITEAVRGWASGLVNHGLMFRGPLNVSRFSESICLKYYSSFYLTVKYME